MSGERQTEYNISGKGICVRALEGVHGNNVVYYHTWEWEREKESVKLLMNMFNQKILADADLHWIQGIYFDQYVSSLRIKLMIKLKICFCYALQILFFILVLNVDTFEFINAIRNNVTIRHILSAPIAWRLCMLAATRVWFHVSCGPLPILLPCLFPALSCHLSSVLSK